MTATLALLTGLLPAAPTARSEEGLGAHLVGRFAEIAGIGPSACLSFAMGAVLTAQVRGEPAAWVAVRSHGLFYPPDAAEAGVDLAALAVVLVPDAAAAGRAADRLVRSGAFGLVVLDLGPEAELPMPLMARLVRLAAAHATAVLCLTVKPPGRPSLGSLVSLRAQARHQRLEGGRFACTLEVLKDKRRGPGRCWEEVRRGPAGLR